MTKEELEIKLNKCFEMAEEMLSKSGEMTSMLDIEFIESDGKKNIIAVMLATGEKEKRDLFIKGLGLVLGAIARIGKIKEVNCVVLMSEAWFSHLSKSEYNLMKDNMRAPSQDPNRREMLIATGLTPDGICLMRSKEMLTVEVKGKKHFSLVDIAEMKNSNPEKIESNMLNNFFVGYKRATEKSDENDRLDQMPGARNKFPDVSVDDLLQRGIKILTQQVGGLDSEFIK